MVKSGQFTTKCKGYRVTHSSKTANITLVEPRTLPAKSCGN